MEYNDNYIAGVYTDTFNKIKEYTNKYPNWYEDNEKYNIEAIFNNKNDSFFYDDIKRAYEKWLDNENQLYFHYPTESILLVSEINDVLQDETSRMVLKWYIQFRATYLITNIAVAEKLYPYPTKSAYYFAKQRLKKVKEKNALFNVEGFTIDSEFEMIAETWICENYLLEGICEPSVGEVVIDAGAFKGETAIWFSEKVGTSGKVYAFEILESHLDIMKKNIISNDLEERIEIVNKGLMENYGRMCVDDNGTSTKCVQEHTANEVDIIPLDSFVKDSNLSKVNFIKMDVEGVELSVLKGAINTIKEFKPKLAIAAYHNYLDIVEIVNFIKSVEPKYKVYLCQKTPIGLNPVLFATI